MRCVRPRGRTRWCVGELRCVRTRGRIRARRRRGADSRFFIRTNVANDRAVAVAVQRTREPALVFIVDGVCRACRIVARINCRRACQQRHRLCHAAVVCARAEIRVNADFVAVQIVRQSTRSTAGAFNEIV